MALRWQQQYKLADWWGETHSGGETPYSLASDLNSAGVRYAYTVGENDVSFLERACAARRGCGVAVLGGSHMVLLVHLDEHLAATIDPNSPGTNHWAKRERFLSEWKNSGSWGVAMLYSPVPPLPDMY